MKSPAQRFTVRSLVKGGEIQSSPISGFFKRWLNGRKPSIILTFFWLYYDEGMLLAFQHEMNFFPTRRPVRIYKPAQPVATAPKWWEEVA